MRAVRLFNNACGEQIGEQIGGEQITVLIRTDISFDVSDILRSLLLFRKLISTSDQLYIHSQSPLTYNW